MSKVVIIQKALPVYRIDFFEGLKSELNKINIELVLVYGQRDRITAAKKDESNIDWAIKIKNHYFHLFGKSLIWQPALKYTKNADLIIVEQANKLIINYLLIIFKSFRNHKLAFWGHGRNHQDAKDSFQNKLKNFFLTLPDWWFAYTSGVKEYLIRNKIAENRITIVQNAINTAVIQKEYQEISEKEVEQARSEFDLNSKNIAIYCGGIYKEKRIDFLLQSAAVIRSNIPDFVLIVIGSGPESYKIKEATQEKDYIKYVGPKFGKEKLIFFRLSTVFLMPGLVGLAVLDSFATATPMVTTEFPFHSPEIEYLENNVNGIITKNNLQSYSKAVIEILSYSETKKRLISGAKKATQQYTIENMVEHFRDGIISCLKK